MTRRLAMLTAGSVLLALGAPPSGARAAVVAGKWCKTYCDVIHVGCKKTIGWLDEDACEEWHQGCLDGCDVDSGS